MQESFLLTATNCLSAEEEDPPQEFNFADDLDLRFVDGDEGQVGLRILLSLS